LDRFLSADTLILQLDFVKCVIEALVQSNLFAHQLMVHRFFSFHLSFLSPTSVSFLPFSLMATDKFRQIVMYVMSVVRRRFLSHLIAAAASIAPVPITPLPTVTHV
jgi:hypothetical protein